MFHIKLTKALSYTGIVSATQKKPDVFVADKATAEAAVATGYFALLDETSDEKTITGHFDRAQLENMKQKELKQLAEDMGIDTTGFKKNSDYIDAIVSVEVTTGDDTIEKEQKDSEADFGEEE